MVPSSFRTIIVRKDYRGKDSWLFTVVTILLHFPCIPFILLSVSFDSFTDFP